MITITGCGNKSVIVNKRQDYEVNSEVKITALISDKNELEIINKDDIVDTSKIGKKEVTIRYKDKREEKEQIIEINVIDTTKPIIEYSKELTTTEGDYDINKEGTYNLKYVALDSSGNKTEEELVLKKILLAD